MEILVSHASYDVAAIRSLIQDLDGAGKQVWLDHDLKGGKLGGHRSLSTSVHVRCFSSVSDNSLKSKPCPIWYGSRAAEIFASHRN